jgi:hypothetical protein
VREPPSAATSPIVRRWPRAPSGTRKKQRAIEFSHTSRMFLSRLPPAQTLQWIDPGAGVNSTRATSSNGCAACGGRGVAEITSIRTSPRAPDADDASVVAAANATANAASRLIMRFRLRSCWRTCQCRRSPGRHSADPDLVLRPSRVSHASHSRLAKLATRRTSQTASIDGRAT